MCLYVNVGFDCPIPNFVREFRGNVEGLYRLLIILGGNKGEHRETTDSHVKKSTHAIDDNDVILSSEEPSDGA